MITIRRRLLAILLPALVILMGIGGLVDYWVAVATTTRAYDRALASAALALEASLRVENEHLRLGSSALDAMGSASGRSMFDGAFDSTMLYSVRGPDHEWLAGVPQFPIPAGTQPQAVGSPTFRDLDFRGMKWRAASVLAETSAGPVQISVAETHSRRARTQRVMLFGKLLVDFAELDITLLLVWIAIYFGLHPLKRLTEQVEQHSSLETLPLELAQVPGELRPVIAAFNRVLELLRHAAQAQQRFVADAAHQMRTPVAGLSAQIELLLKEPRAASVAGQVGVLQRGIAQLARSANQMLALARAEPFSGAPEKSEAVDLRRLVEQMVERHVERADQGGIDLGAEARDATVDGNAWLLEDLLENLIDNALKYTPQGGHVTVRCGTDGKGATYLEVEDDGPGIPDAERQRVRERFYRRPGSPGIGCGLGLAIVDQIAAAHRAIFTITGAADGRGARMRIRFGPQEQ